jgi:hypothetical protein
MNKRITGIFLISALSTFTNTWAGGIEDNNGCRGNKDDPCMRRGYCSIQGSDWYQLVTASRSDKFDTQGWSGLCDMVHVALVQGNCMPIGSQMNVTAYLSASSYAVIDAIQNGSLTCGGDDAGSSGGGSDFCNSHPGHRNCR